MWQRISAEQDDGLGKAKQSIMASLGSTPLADPRAPRGSEPYRVPCLWPASGVRLRRQSRRSPSQISSSEAVVHSRPIRRTGLTGSGDNAAVRMRHVERQLLSEADVQRPPCWHPTRTEPQPTCASSARDWFARLSAATKAQPTRAAAIRPARLAVLAG